MGSDREEKEAALIVLAQIAAADQIALYFGDEDIFRALKAGAIAYLLKDAGRDELLSAVRAAFAGQKYIQPNVALKLAERIHGNDLTNRELQVLEGILDGYANKEIGNRLSISEGTVKNHVNSILDKLGASDRTQAVLIAVKRGLLIEVQTSKIDFFYRQPA